MPDSLSRKDFVGKIPGWELPSFKFNGLNLLVSYFICNSSLSEMIVMLAKVALSLMYQVTFIIVPYSSSKESSKLGLYRSPKAFLEMSDFN